jgi:hypothetical protein
MAASSDGNYIFGLTDSIRFVYQVSSHSLLVTGSTASPPLGPRVVSVAADGSYFAAGWAVFSKNGASQAQFPNPSGQLAVGSHAVDSKAGLIYSQIPPPPAAGSAAPPLLTISDSDNLTTRDQVQLPEDLTGRSLLNSTATVMYSVSDSGVLVLPVGSLNRAHRLASDHEALAFRGSFCQRGAVSQSFQLTDPGGGRTAFSLNTNLSGVTINPSSGYTPAVIQVQVDPAAFQNQSGTISGAITITSNQAVNLPPPIRLLVNSQRPDERGTSVDLPGTLVDVLADPLRDRFYILRQDRNQALVFDGSGMAQIASLRTATTPTRMAFSFDRKFLLVGHDNSQLVTVYDLDALASTLPVVFWGHYPRSLAESGGSILAAVRTATGSGVIDRIDLASRTASTITSLGVFKNSITVDTVLAPAPDGSAIMAASADGTVFLYDAGVDTFTVSHKIGASAAGAYAASGDGWFVLGNVLLNNSLVPAATWSGAQFYSGFAFWGGQGIQLNGPQSGAGADGLIQRVDLKSGTPTLPTRVNEQPLVSQRLPCSRALWRLWPTATPLSRSLLPDLLPFLRISMPPPCRLRSRASSMRPISLPRSLPAA